MKIQQKLFLILSSFSLALVSVLVVLMQWSIGNGMIDYVNAKEVQSLTPVTEKLIREYKKQHSWRSYEGQHRKLKMLILQQQNGRLLEHERFEHNGPRRGPPPHDMRRREPRNFDLKSDNSKAASPKTKDYLSKGHQHEGHRRGPPGPPPNNLVVNHALLDAQSKVVAGHFNDNMLYSKTPLMLDNNIIGYFAIEKRQDLADGFELAFVEQQQHYLIIIAIFVMLMVVAVTFPLSQHIVLPIKMLTNGMHQLTKGHYKQQLLSTRKDEIGELIQYYDELSLTLAENDSARKRWLANISHELRTPVAILKGELEAMIDGVRPLSHSSLGSINEEVMQLQRLIEDLHQLTSADIGGMAYRKEKLSVLELLQSETDKHKSYLAAENITLLFDHKAVSEKLMIYADSTRIHQLFNNIFTNTLKYSQAKHVQLSAVYDSENRQVCIIIEDDGVGVNKEHLIHLFEHLYRAEQSRNRHLGGSGLGLSICAHIIKGHKGEIFASKSALGGLAIHMCLPIVT